MNALDDFERAAIFRRNLAARLGLADGKDPDGVGIALGPDEKLLVTMPLHVAEKLLASDREAVVAEVVAALRTGEPHHNYPVWDRAADFVEREFAGPVTT